MTKLRNAAPEGVCENCGRHEVVGAYCTYCLASPFSGIVRPTVRDTLAVRHALIALHGWKSPVLCFEITRARARLTDYAVAQGFGGWGWTRPKGYTL